MSGDRAHAATQLVGRQLEQRVERSANFAATAQLLAFQLEATAIVVVAQVEGVFERRPPHAILDALVGIADVFPGHVTRHGFPLSRDLPLLNNKG